MRRLLGRPVWVALAVLILLAPPLLLTLLRLWGPDLATLVRLTSFAPLAAPWLLVALLVLVIGLLRRRGGPLRALLTVLVAGALGLQIWWNAPAYVENTADLPQNAPRIQVLNVNMLKGGADVPAILKTVAQERVDILVLEEVTEQAVDRLEQLGLTAALPYSAGEPGETTSGTMLFSRYRVRDVERLDTSFDSWSADLVLPTGTIRVYAVHVAAPMGDAETWHDDLAALRQAAMHDPELDLVIGDLNATRDHAPFRDLLTDGKLVDAAERAGTGWQPTWPVGGRYRVLGVPLPLSVAIDHVLLGSRMVVLSVETVAIDGTDHRALLADVALR